MALRTAAAVAAWTMSEAAAEALDALQLLTDGGDGSTVDRFLATVAEQPGGLLVAPIVKMMRSIAA